MSTSPNNFLARLSEPAGPAPSAATIYELCAFAPRLLVQVAAIAALGGLVYGCVPAKQYEAAETAANQQAEARKHDQAKLRQAEERIAIMSAELNRKHSALEQEQSSMAASKLETTLALKDREAAQLLVDQLRSDLARAGDHLAWFGVEKRDLGKALMLAEQRMDDVERASANLGELVGVSRDLSLMLGENQTLGELTLSAKDGIVTLEVPELRLFAENSSALVVDAAPVLAGIARTSSAHGALKLAVRAPGDQALEKSRAEKLCEALAERGVPRANMAVELTPSATAPVASQPSTPKPDSGEAAQPAPAPAATPKPYLFAFVP